MSWWSALDGPTRRRLSTPRSSPTCRPSSHLGYKPEDDGVFGTETATALKQFQVDNGLPGTRQARSGHLRARAHQRMSAIVQTREGAQIETPSIDEHDELVGRVDTLEGAGLDVGAVNTIVNNAIAHADRGRTRNA
jgi:peptidoglycan hydrolase-like protein with peptidoglycan-binding domain